MRKIQMMGIDHSRATVAERELFSLTKAKQKELMEAVIRQQGVGGCVLLSTCNRTELYLVVDQLHTGRYYSKHFLADWFQIDIFD